MSTSMSISRPLTEYDTAQMRTLGIRLVLFPSPLRWLRLLRLHSSNWASKVSTSFCLPWASTSTPSVTTGS